MPRCDDMANRLFALLLVPVITILVLSRMVVNDANEATEEARQVAALAVVAEQIAQVDQALNDEALAGAEAIARPERWGGLVDEEFVRTDQSLTELRSLAVTEPLADSFGERLVILLNQFDEGIERRDDIREGTVSPLQLLDRYVTFREALIDELDSQTRTVGGSQTKNALGGLIALIDARSAHLNERISSELALTYGTWPPRQHSAAVTAAAIGESHVEVALALRQQPSDFAMRRPTALVNFRNQMLAGTAVPSIDRSRYVFASNTWLDVLNEEIETEAAAITEDFQSAAMNAETDRAITIGWITAALITAVISAGVLGYRLVHRVGLIAHRARAFAEGKRVVDSSPATVRGRDEIAVLSQVFDDMAMKVELQARYDALTGLANRRTTLDSWHDWVKNSPSGSTAVFAIDLDGFKQINDRYGHFAGDETLREVAERFQDVVSPYGGLLGRLGGDEFLFIVRDLSPETDLVDIGERLRSSLEPPVLRGSTTAVVGASVGIAHHRAGANAQQLLNDADNALYVAKVEGRNRVVESSPALRKRLDEKRSVRERILPALSAGEFIPYFQPICNGQGDLVAFEALVRWRQSDGTVLGPGAFMDAVAARGALHVLDAVVLRAVCDTSSEWRAAGLPAAAIHVNVSPESVAHHEFVESVKESIATVDARAGVLVLEVTEDGLMSDINGSAQRLAELRNIGVGIGVDDFGTGHSSLAYLRDLPVDILKLDRLFIDGIHKSRSNQAIVRNVLNLANELGMSVVAEGVENESERDWLAAHNVPLLQGYLLGRPVPADKAARLLWMGGVRRGGDSVRSVTSLPTPRVSGHELKSA